MFPFWLVGASVVNFEKLGRFFVFFPSGNCTSRNAELNDNFFVRYIFQARSVLHTLFSKSLRHAFFLWPFWTQYTNNLLSCINLQNNQIYFHVLIFKTIKFKKRERLKNIWIKKLESDIFSIPLTLTSSKTEGKMNFLNQNSNYVIKNCYMFDLNDFEFELREFNCTSKFLV